MSRPAPLPPPARGGVPLHAVQVLGGGCAGTGAHVRSLASGLVARGLRVTVCAPPGAELNFGFAAAGAHFAPVARRTCPGAFAALRAVSADADLVHAHGLRAGLFAAAALGNRRRRVPLVVTWHSRDPAGGGLMGALTRVLERRVLRSASVVLGAGIDLVERARHCGARDARLAPVALPAPREAADCPPASGPGGLPADESAECRRNKVRAELGAVDRPLVLTIGRLDRHHGYPTALSAARAWRHCDPLPLLAIAGEGPQRAALQARIDAEDLPVRLLGSREDAIELLAGADIALFSARRTACPLLAQEALRSGVPLVATDVGGIPGLVGDGALLVPYGDADALARAVTGLLADPGRRAALAARGRAQAPEWPSEDQTTAHVLSVYDEVAQRGSPGGF